MPTLKKLLHPILYKKKTKKITEYVSVEKKSLLKMAYFKSEKHYVYI